MRGFAPMAPGLRVYSVRQSGAALPDEKPSDAVNPELARGFGRKGGTNAQKSLRGDARCPAANPKAGAKIATSMVVWGAAAKRPNGKAVALGWPGL